MINVATAAITYDTRGVDNQGDMPPILVPNYMFNNVKKNMKLHNTYPDNDYLQNIQFDTICTN